MRLQPLRHINPSIVEVLSGGRAPAKDSSDKGLPGRSGTASPQGRADSTGEHCKRVVKRKQGVGRKIEEGQGASR